MNQPFPNKLVAILNKTLEPGVVMNALAHMVVGLGAQVGGKDLQLDNYQDKDGYVYPNISQMPFIILRGTSSEMAKIVNQAREQNIIFGTFIQTMTGGTYIEQLENTAKTLQADIVYYGVTLFGEWNIVSHMTRKLSLYK